MLQHIINGTEVKFRTKKSEELLAFLIDKYGKNVPRNLIIDSLWSDFEGDKALINFNTTLSYTRKLISHYSMNLQIIYEHGSYKLEPRNIKCDYFSFVAHELFDTKITSHNLAFYKEILSLYTGGYLEVNNYLWAEGNRLNLKEKYIRLLLLIVNYYQNEKQNAKAIELLKSGITFAPLNKKIITNLINLLFEEGNDILATEYSNLLSRKFT